MNADPDPTPPERESTSDAGSDAATASDIAALRAELVAHKERYLRLAADFDNFRKRTTQETERRAAAQKEAFILELLPVIDNLERALGSDVSTSPEQLREGVQMTLQQLNQLLRRHGIEPEESLGQRFDPRYHEAVAVRLDPSQPDRIVLETFQRGYRRGNEVFRPAKVVVNDLSHAVNAIPALALFKAGREVARQGGAMPASAIRQFIEQAG
jgi:molecular chaperone GrpE